MGFLSQVLSPVPQRYSIYDQELLALVTALDKWRHLLRAAKVTAYTDHQALTYLQHISTQKPLRGRTARWLDFLAEFPDLTITYLQGTRNRVAGALSRHTQHVPPTPTPLPLSSLTSAASSNAPPPARYHTRAKPRDFRAEAGLRPTRPRRTATPSPPTTASSDPDSPPSDPPPSPRMPDPPPALTPDVDPLTPQRWADAYPLCPHFSTAFAAAKQQDGDEVPHELQGRRYTFRFHHPYLHICIHGLWRICAPTLPEFLSHLLYRHHDHVFFWPPWPEEDLSLPQ